MGVLGYLLRQGATILDLRARTLREGVACLGSQ